ncbi:hypothetical protein RU639_013604 [Aspergillus parasiticus]
MPSYSLTVEIDRKWVKKFNEEPGWALCLACGVGGSGKESFNIIANTSKIADSVEFSWQDEYAISGTFQEFSGFAKVKAVTTPEPIEFGQSCTLKKNFIPQPAVSDELAPQNGFRFVQETEASCILYRKVEGKLRPIFITPETNTMVSQTVEYDINGIWGYKDDNSRLYIGDGKERALE